MSNYKDSRKTVITCVQSTHPLPATALSVSCVKTCFIFTTTWWGSAGIMPAFKDGSQDSEKFGNLHQGGKSYKKENDFYHTKFLASL